MSRKTWVWATLGLWATVLLAAKDLGEERFSLSEETRLAEQARQGENNIEKEFGGVLADEEINKRVNEVGQKMAEAAFRVGPRQINTDPPPEGQAEPARMQFTFQVLNSEEVNAFSLWGGRIYMTKGLLDFVQSDHELAGVLGHELGHSMRHHLMKQLKKERETGQTELAVIIAALLGGKNIDVGQLIFVAEWVRTAILSGHSVRDEAEADTLGVLYAHAAGYNPVGLLTFMERLDRLQKNLPSIQGRRDQPGIGAAQTHPWSDERAQAIARQIREDLGLEINRRAVVKPLQAEARPVTVKEVEIAEVVIGNVVVFQPADKGEYESPLARAQALADHLNQLLQRRHWPLRLRHLQLDKEKPVVKAVSLKSEILFEVLPGDAEFHETSARDLVNQVFKRMHLVLQMDEVNNQKI